MSVELGRFKTDNNIVNSVLGDSSTIRINLRVDDKCYEYFTGSEYNKIIKATFVYDNNIVSQAFYRNNGTWVPFDGIKANVNENNKFYQYLDTDPFKTKYEPFGDLKLMAVSYILGGGVWISKDDKWRKILNVPERISQFDPESVKVQFNDSLVINQYINYSISRNYYKNHPNKDDFFKPKSRNWFDGNEQSLFSAFDHSAKMNNYHQIEYTPPVLLNRKKRKDYKDFYELVDNSEVKVPKDQSSYCTIL